jgi:hypothetical protein
MIPSVSHRRDDESIEPKARWSPWLTMEERMERPCEFTDLMRALNPEIAEPGRASSSTGRIRVLSLQEAC